MQFGAKKAVSNQAAIQRIAKIARIAEIAEIGSGFFATRKWRQRSNDWQALLICVCCLLGSKVIDSEGEHALFGCCSGAGGFRLQLCDRQRATNTRRAADTFSRGKEACH